MMRALWTAASGMTSQQQNVDTISNNIANVNTYGYKKERLEFKTLLYETMQEANLDPVNQTGRPTNLQVGHGVRPIATARMYTSGNMERTDNPTDISITGQGFFVVDNGDANYAYTKDGAMKVSNTENGLMLVTSEGYPILDVNDEPIILPPNIGTESMVVEAGGNISYTAEDGTSTDLGQQIKLVQFTNPQGLKAVGSNLLKTTSASGDPLVEADDEVAKKSSLNQGVLEMSNVQVAQEMVDLIVAQRAYELNSKAIQTADSMLQLANNLKN